MTARVQKWNALQTIFMVFASCFNSVFTYLSLAIERKTFLKRYLKKNKNGTKYFDINNARLPYLSKKYLIPLARYCFYETFFVSCYYHDDYTKRIVEALVPFTNDGPYGYQDGDFDVTVKQNDIVIDAGAWIGDFSAYAASKGALVYAFEPTPEVHDILKSTAALNKTIIPVQKGLGDKKCEMPFYVDDTAGGCNSLYRRIENTFKTTVQISTLDEFVEETGLKRIDFIKADIEGAERLMLKGATTVLKKYAPKLAICTYHCTDDPQVLEKLILDANPDYKVIHIKKKLFACVL